MAAAFPPRLHSWIFYVLSSPGIPAPFIAALRELYSDMNVKILMGGRIFDGFRIEVGVNKAVLCPLSSLTCASTSCCG
eukprot:5388991-Pyramimonas_sp.AAC.1